ncbi:MAG: hypothetical protein GY786_06900 [Proteobacteria bacterium]|nr:hypothetical protein [Pseudomonadota bacterium]
MKKTFNDNNLFGSRLYIILSIIFLFEFSSAIIGQTHHVTHDTYQLIKKKEWLTIHGMTAWIGSVPDRFSVQACRQNEHAILYLKPWGIAKINSNAKIIFCPNFFFKNDRNYTPRK